MLGKSEVWKREEADGISQEANDTWIAFKPRGLDTSAVSVRRGAVTAGWAKACDPKWDAF